MSENYELEDTTEIEVADNNIGMLLKVIAVALILTCIGYFAGMFFPDKNKEEQKDTPATEQVQPEKEKPADPEAEVPAGN